MVRLNAKACAFSGGIIWGAMVFVATIWLMVKGTEGKTISLLGNFYLGYSFSWGGALLGLIWGFVSAFILCFIGALVYNAFLPKES